MKDRRHPPIVCRTWLAIVAAVLALIVYRPAEPASVRGVTRNGSAYVCEMNPPYPLIQFCVFFTKERR